VLLVKAGLPIEGSLVLTGSLLRFLPGAELVSGMHDLIAGAYMSGVVRLAEVLLLGAAIAGSASLILTVGENMDVDLRITASGAADWPAAVIVVAGAVAVAFNACRLGVPPRRLLSVVVLGALSVVIAQGFTPLFDDLSRNARTLLAAVVIGALGTYLAHRRRTPAAIWTVPAILPLLPAPATFLPLLAATDAGGQALQGQALQTAFAIGVGVAPGSIIVATYQRYRDRVLEPVVDAVSDGLSRYVACPAQRRTSRFRLKRADRRGTRSRSSVAAGGPRHTAADNARQGTQSGSPASVSVPALLYSQTTFRLIRHLPGISRWARRDSNP
jgi:uncharacterized membrane protein YjjB (DUF3815 family)